MLESSTDVRYWHLADIAFCTAHVRFRCESGPRIFYELGSKAETDSRET